MRKEKIETRKSKKNRMKLLKFLSMIKIKEEKKIKEDDRNSNRNC